MRTETFRRPLWVGGVLLLLLSAVFAFEYFTRHWDRVPQRAWLSEAAPARGQIESAPPVAAFDDTAFVRRLGDRKAPRAAKSGSAGDAGLEVTATFCEADPKQCQAIVSDRAKKQTLVRVGDTVGDYRITRIIRDGIYVSRGEGDQFITVSSGPSVSAGPAAKPAAAASHVPDLPPPVMRTSIVRRTRDLLTITPEQRETYARDLDDILAQVEVAPHADGKGATIGLRLVKVPADSVAAERGFREGDVIKEVFGTALKDPAILPDLAARIFREAPAIVQVVLDRDGREQTRLYRVQ